MAMTTFDANAYDMDTFDIAIWRRHDRITLDCCPLQNFGIDCSAADFVRWCRTNGTKLHTKVVGILYQPAFRDEEAAERFRRTWMIEANLTEGRR